MKKKLFTIVGLLLTIGFCFSFKTSRDSYTELYSARNHSLDQSFSALLKLIDTSDLNDSIHLPALQLQILQARISLKSFDFWSRYLEPIAYKQMNGPLPVEWETEVFEKFEPPYKRDGAGLTLAALYLEGEHPSKDSLRNLIRLALSANSVYREDSIMVHLSTFDHFYFCNRLYILNLAAIYTTGFECPDPSVVIPELLSMMESVIDIYRRYNESFPQQKLSEQYLKLYNNAIDFVQKQEQNPELFNHFLFIRDYVNPLFTLNQNLLLQYRALTKSTMDFSLNKSAPSIFSKSLYAAQNSKGIFFNVEDKDALALMNKLGKMLFYDPVLSGNNQRSCASCHKPTEFFTDTSIALSFAFDHTSFLPRNTPSLINVPYNHLIMQDGKHISLQDQTREVVHKVTEMGAQENEVLDKVMSCDEYKKGFTSLLRFTPMDDKLTFDHIASVLTFYYSKFSNATALFDDAMNNKVVIGDAVIRGFNLFMSKAQCATCHFVPQFNGVKPPYVGSEFEVLGTPATNDYASLSKDVGRYMVNPAKETMNAFRTGGLRNIMHTAPYMHNGVFKTIEEVIDFYDAGGGLGHGLSVTNQTLSADSLHLSTAEKADLIAFLRSLDEQVPFEPAPKKLPISSNKELNNRKVGGLY